MNIRWLTSLLLLAALALAIPSQAGAHAYMERSTPLPNAELDAPPQAIRIAFTESVDAKLSSIALEDGSGRAVAGELSAENENTLVYKIPKLEKGIYTVRWQVLSVDGHVTDDAFRFSVGVPVKEERPSETISLDGPAAEPAPKPSEQIPAAEAPPEAAPSAKPKPAPAVKPTDEGPKREVSPDAKADQTEAENDRTEPAASHPQEESAEEAAQPGEPKPASALSAALPTPAPPTAAVPESHEHDHSHQSASGEFDWRGLTHAALRVFEIAAAVAIAAFAFNRYVLWRGAEELMPALFTKRNERLLLAAALAGFGAAGALHVWMLAAQVSGFDPNGVPDTVRTILSSTKVGFAAWMGPALIALMLALSFSPPRDERWAAWVQALAALGLISLFPLAGHAGGNSSGMLPAVLAHTLHMAAAAVWFGGLAGILAATRRLTVASLHWPDLDAVIRRFSRIAFVLIAAVAATGVYLSLLRLEAWGELVGTAYGRLVLVKTALLLLVAVIGVFHRLAFIPRLTAAANGVSPADDGVRRSFLRGVRVEIVLALAAFLLAGILSTTAPPDRSPGASEPVYWHVMGDKAHMSFRMNGEPEPQSFRLDVWLPKGIGAAKSVEVNANLMGAGAAADIPFSLVSGGPDPYGFEGFDKFTYEARGDYLSPAGAWAITIRIADSAGLVHTYENTIDVK